MTALDFLQKAERALNSAQALLDLGDVDGACNRAYYAMFDAARAALQALPDTNASEAFKTHSGLISAFSLHLVKSGRVPVEFGRSLNRLADLRQVADYANAPIDMATAKRAVDEARLFVEQMRALTQD
jgi:uncharacterized protein (UPF0332 family)